jgi:hypothetical protein
MAGLHCLNSLANVGMRRYLHQLLLEQLSPLLETTKSNQLENKECQTGDSATQILVVVESKKHHM